MASIIGELKSTLSTVYVDTARAVLHRLERAGVPQTIDAERAVFQRLSSTQSAARYESSSENVLTAPPSLMPEGPWLGDQEMVAVRACSAKLAEHAAASLPYWAPFPAPVGPLLGPGVGVPQYAEDASGWVARMIVAPALYHHLALLPRVDQADDATARAFAEDVLAVVTATDLRYLVTLPFSGIYMGESDPITVGDVTVRSLSSVEQGAIFQQRARFTSLMLDFGEVPYSALELRVSGPRTEQHLTVCDRIPALTTAFQLHGYEISGRFAIERSDPPWVRDGQGHFPSGLPRRSWPADADAEFSANDLEAIVKTAKLLERHHVSEPASAQDLALHRFAAGLARESHADGVVDFTIALEALLLPYDENARHGDLGYRFRVHGAHYLAEDPAERRDVWKQLKGIYETRSRLVHGGKYPVKGEIVKIHDLARDFARRGLLRALVEGFPTSQMFTDMALS
ncbi:hypothetical protein [Alloactinosynnema sp. L-07]|uniref:HEPN domain-containing protein n=1 Tax=Alloactinosynnema sp. L-07 TaxID=1653480 RepID=UPI00065EFD3B|nr:HEPN domain-containing protein [Alloactinosynnema sp. L-07]CRK55432.1 hypothetical protein [Alloactinosynnema sp. L-07]